MPVWVIAPQSAGLLAGPAWMVMPMVPVCLWFRCEPAAFLAGGRAVFGQLTHYIPDPDLPGPIRPGPGPVGTHII